MWSRLAQQGRVVPRQYGAVTAIALDPMEKKPLYHFYPGRNVLSVGGIGCNLSCSFCQNYHIAHEPAPVQILTPEQVIEFARRLPAARNNLGIAFTYNEPTVGFEFVRDTSQLAQSYGLKTVLVTNGYLQPDPWRELLAYTDALNIDVKAFTEAFYQEHCGASLAPVLRNVAEACQECHVELTYLVIPGQNDDVDDFRRFAQWVAQLSPNIAVHLTRFFPSYKMQIIATPLSILQGLQQIALEYLNFVYLGNVNVAANTYCPVCNELLIRRYPYAIECIGIRDGYCSHCGQRLPIVLKGNT